MIELTKEQVANLAAVDTPTVANVIELFGLQSRAAGFANERIRAVYAELPPAVGYAVTATFRTGYSADHAASYGDLPKLMEQSQLTPEPRMMVFQDLDEPVRAATYGELMATAFQRFGFAGLITSGAGRDIEQVRGLKFPCWTTGMIASHGYCRVEEINIPVTVCGLRICPGDLIHADGNGIVLIPELIAKEVAELCAPYVNTEDILLNYLHGQGVTPAGYTAAMDQMKLAMENLRLRAVNSLKRSLEK